MLEQQKTNEEHEDKFYYPKKFYQVIERKDISKMLVALKKAEKIKGIPKYIVLYSKETIKHEGQLKRVAIL